MSGASDADVERALSAMGATPLKYHSFGAITVRPQTTPPAPGAVAPDPRFHATQAARVFPLLGMALPEAFHIDVEPVWPAGHPLAEEAEAEAALPQARPYTIPATSASAPAASAFAPAPFAPPVYAAPATSPLPPERQAAFSPFTPSWLDAPTGTPTAPPPAASYYAPPPIASVPPAPVAPVSPPAPHGAAFSPFMSTPAPRAEPGAASLPSWLDEPASGASVPRPILPHAVSPHPVAPPPVEPDGPPDWLDRTISVAPMRPSPAELPPAPLHQPEPADETIRMAPPAPAPSAPLTAPPLASAPLPSAPIPVEPPLPRQPAPPIVEPARVPATPATPAAGRKSLADMFRTLGGPPA